MNARMALASCCVCFPLLYLVDGSAQPSMPPSTESAARRTLTFDDRVVAQRAIEQVYWNRRVWSADNPTAKPRLGSVLPEAAIRARVEQYLRQSTALEQGWHHPGFLRGHDECAVAWMNART